MKDKTTSTKVKNSDIAYVYNDPNPERAEFEGHYALNNEGLSVGKIGLEHNGKQNPIDNLCAKSAKGKYGYPSFARLLPAIEVHNFDGEIIGYRFEYI